MIGGPAIEVGIDGLKLGKTIIIEASRRRVIGSLVVIGCLEV